MPRIITLTMEITDEEHANFLQKFVDRASVETDDADDDTATDAGTGGDGLDKNGTPWLADVHSSSKAKNQDGTWRARKGVDKAVVKQAEETARADLNNGGQVTTTVAGGAGTQFDVTTDAPITAAPTGMPALGGMPAGMPMGMPTMPVTAPEPQPITYQQVIDRFTELHNAGKVDANSIQGLYQKAGVTNPNDLSTNETLRAALMAEFDKIQ